MEDNLEAVDYIAQVKSPYEEDDTDQEDLEFQGYLRYAQDCILKSIGTLECVKFINLYWTQLEEELDKSAFEQFMTLALSTIIKTYKMSFLSELLMSSDIPAIDLEKKKKLFLFLEHDQWQPYWIKCLSPINEKLVRDDEKLKVFLKSDYESFIKKIESYKKFNEYIKLYFKFCNEDEGLETLFLILKKDLLNVFIQQYQKQKVK